MGFLPALAVATVLGGCSFGSGANTKEKPPPTTTVLGAGSRQDCQLTSIDEVRAIFGAPVGASIEGHRCQYTVADGEVRFQIWRGAEVISELAPDGDIIDKLGTLALWAPAPRRGGVLAVETGRHRLVFEILLDGDPVVVRSRGVDWARRIVGRLAKADDHEPRSPTTTTPREGGTTTDPGAAGTTVPSTTTLPATDPCTLLPRAAAEELRATVVEAPASEVCDYALPEGTLRVGPKNSPVTAGVLDQVYRSSSVDGVEQPWERVAVEGVGDQAVRLVDPANAGSIDLYVIDGTELLHLTVWAADAARAEAIAITAAKAVVADR